MKLKRSYKAIANLQLKWLIEQIMAESSQVDELYQEFADQYGPIETYEEYFKKLGWPNEHE